MKKFLILMIAFCMTMEMSFAGTFNANAKTKRIPAGTTFNIKFNQSVSTFSGSAGDSFVATIMNETSSDANVIIPAGTIVRGSLSQVKTAKRFSRGGMLYLDFDHVVTPTGRQIPLDMAVCSFENINYDGGLYKNLGYGEAVKNNYNRAVEMTKNATNYGLKVKDSAPGLQYLTTPVCAVGGFFGGVGYVVGDSILDMFRKGSEVYINENDELTVKLLNPIDIPVY